MNFLLITGQKRTFDQW